MIFSSETHATSQSVLGDADWRIIGIVEQFLADAIELKKWWECASATQSYHTRFTLERTFHRPDRSFGFFDEVQLKRGRMPIMGSVQDMFFDQLRVPASMIVSSAEWMRNQVRQFVLRYFMRISSFRPPEAATPHPHSAVDSGGLFNWCPQSDVRRQGFGFSQLYYKRVDGVIGRFSSDEESTIIDVRELFHRYEWIIAKVEIFDFDFRFRPFINSSLEVLFGLNEESYLVLSKDFILDCETPSEDYLGSYGIGYGFVRTPGSALIAYGPGQFDAAFELIQFHVLRSGRTDVHMVFVANRPDRILRLEIQPVKWAFELANLMSLGFASKVLSPLREIVDSLPCPDASFDPIYEYIGVANALTGGWAGERLCISREELDKRFLIQHFMQHYNTIMGSLLTWRQIPDWTDEAALPQWVLTGRAS